MDDVADVTVVDMEAGLEHLARAGGTLASADVLLVVVEPSFKALLTAARTRALADELGIPRTCLVGNKARLPEDGELLSARCAELGLELAGVVPYDPDVDEADRAGQRLPAGRGSAVRAAVSELAGFLELLPATQ
jgi:CO dehydrogenase maturation factor